MPKAVSNWKDAADDAYSHLSERKRVHSLQKMLSFVDELAQREVATQEKMMQLHGDADFLATTLGHVTTAIHGAGSVPKAGGWYRTTLDPHTYYITPEFAAAWRAKRRLQRLE